MHLTPNVALPRSVPDGVALLVWPETAVNVVPLLAEGPGRGTKLPPLIPGSTARHLIGLRTKLPGGSLQNQAVAVEADGRVIASRAKQLFLPVAERRFLGVGGTPYRSGSAPPIFSFSRRSIVPLICGEGLSRGLLAEGVAAGGELWTVLAGDQWLASERASASTVPGDPSASLGRVLDPVDKGILCWLLHVRRRRWTRARGE
jgi:hypothetical protein